MGRKIQICLVYRDMWQSSGKYMPRVDQLVRVAEPIVDMGCFSRIETNGGGFEQINLLFGENPNKAVRDWTQPFNDAGIQTQMLERGLNGIRMYPVPKDVRKLMFSLKKKQGTDIARSFDGLNYAPNLELSFKYAKEGGMIAQGALCITHSRIHTVQYYIDLADTFIEMGAEEIAIKDMAGIGRPVSLGEIVKGIKKRHPKVIVQMHNHSGPGFSVTSQLEAVRAGADIVDVSMEPISWGTGHADLLTVHAMLKDAGYEVPDINMSAYMKARSLTKEFVDDFLGYYIAPRNYLMNSLLIGPGLPGGMMGSLMADLESNLEGVNRWLKKNGKPEMTQDDLLIKLFDEVEYIWPKLGYPPLVTPYSQYVKNLALMNVIQMTKGNDRWSMIADNIWDMILGRSGQLPGPVDEEIQKLAEEQDREFFKGNPQDLYPDELDKLREEMKENGWETGQDDEELFEYAMHPEQYKKFRSGEAKEAFNADLDKRKAEKEAPAATAPAVGSNGDFQPQTLNLDINGEKYVVKISYDNGSPDNGSEVQAAPQVQSNGSQQIVAPLEGTFMLTKDSGETPLQAGDTVSEGDVIGYIESMKVYNAIISDKAGKVVRIVPSNGEKIFEDDIILEIE